MRRNKNKLLTPCSVRQELGLGLGLRSTQAVKQTRVAYKLRTARFPEMRSAHGLEMESQKSTQMQGSRSARCQLMKRQMALRTQRRYSCSAAASRRRSWQTTHPPQFSSVVPGIAATFQTEYIIPYTNLGQQSSMQSLMTRRLTLNEHSHQHQLAYDQLMLQIGPVQELASRPVERQSQSAIRLALWKRKFSVNRGSGLGLKNNRKEPEPAMTSRASGRVPTAYLPQSNIGPVLQINKRDIRPNVSGSANDSPQAIVPVTSQRTLTLLTQSAKREAGEWPQTSVETRVTAHTCSRSEGLFNNKVLMAHTTESNAVWNQRPKPSPSALPASQAQSYPGTNIHPPQAALRQEEMAQPSCLRNRTSVDEDAIVFGDNEDLILNQHLNDLPP